MPPALPGMMPGQAPGGFSPAPPPTTNPGLQAMALSQVRAAIEMLEKSLPSLPTGEPVHEDVLSAITKLSKHAPASAAVPGIQSQQLAGMQKTAQQQQLMQMLMRQQQAGGAGGAPPGGAPAPGAQPDMPGGQ